MNQNHIELRGSRKPRQIMTTWKSASIFCYFEVFIIILYFTPIKVNTPVNFAPSDQDVEWPNDLSTIDVEAFAGLSASVAPSPLASLPQLPSAPARLTVNTSVTVSTPVSEELIRSCVTPRKVESIQGALEKECERHRCALKLLPYFFTREELTRSNTDGSHGKERLDATKLNSIKVLIFSKFPSDCPVENEKLRRSVKGKINAKCRASKFACTGREI